jgi:hypothetical protein
MPCVIDVDVISRAQEVPLAFDVEREVRQSVVDAEERAEGVVFH